MKKFPSLIPYIIKRHTEIDPITGDKTYEYSKEFHLYDVESKRILMQDTPLKNISYIDYSFEESTALVMEKRNKGVSSYSIVETKHDLENPLWFDTIKVISSSIIIAGRNGLYGIIDSRKSIKIFFEYEDIEAYRDPLVFVARKDGKYGIITIDNQIVLPFRYSSITHNSELGILVAQDVAKTAIYNILDGTVSTILCGCRFVRSISEGIAVLQLDNWRYVLYNMETMKLINNFSYKSATPMINGFSLCSNYIIVNKDGSSIELEKGCYEKSGEVIYKTEYIDDNNWKITTYIRDKYISSFIHKKSGYGTFSHGCYLNKYIRLSSFNDKYGIHNNIQYYDLYGNPLDFESTHKIVEAEKMDVMCLSETVSRSQSNLHLQHRLDNVEYEEFIKNYFPDGLECDEFYIYEIAPNLYHVRTLAGSCDDLFYYFVGYIVNGKKLWQNISITDKE